MPLTLSNTLQLAPRLEQKLKITPQMRQSLRVLEFSADDLKSYLENELAANPFLEEARPARLKENFRARSMSGEEAERRRHFEEAAMVGPPSLETHLWNQTRILNLSADERNIATEIIGNLNEDGYLSTSLSEIAQSADASLKETEEVLVKIQSLDPPGVAARNLAECLLIQLRFSEPRPDSPKFLAVQIVKNHLEALKTKKFKKISKALNVSFSKVQESVREIRRLDPRPGLNFSTVRPITVVPDIIIKKYGKRYRVMSREREFPDIQINASYRKSLEAYKNISGEKKYLKERMRSAFLLLKALDKRGKTLERLARCLVTEQREFLERGPAHLKPFTMKQAAHILELHKSTVSRAARHKYVETPHGIFEFKFFFGAGPPGPGKLFSGRSIQSRIQKIIKKENKKKPLPDDEILAILKSQGIQLSRRTVAKYRQKLRIQSSYIRKVI